MPELPEVETIVRYLAPRLRGKKIADIISDTPRLFRPYALKNVRPHVLGKTVRGAERAGKNIILRFDGGALALHLMMSGRLFLDPQAEPPHARMKILFADKGRLVFSDARKFGRVRWLGKGDVQSLGIGPDALSLDLETFKLLMRGRKGAIKNILLNQNLLSGIGNIYADEILWHAGVHPLRKAQELSGAEVARLWRGTRAVLRLAIVKEGTTMRDYLKPDGNGGGYWKVRKVYAREGEKCYRDGAKIRRVVIGNRSAHFCPKHQH